MTMTETNPDIPTQAVFERVVARPVATPALHHTRLVHVRWRAPQQADRLVQVYVNRRLSAVTRRSAQREAWLVLDPALHHEIELLAVAPASSAQDHAALLQGPIPRTTPAVELALLRDVAQPIDARVRVTANDAADAACAPLFSGRAARAGFGAVFGEGGFGYDAATGPGLGLGELGLGPLGVDGAALRYRDAALPSGAATLDLTLTSPAGEHTCLDLERTIDRLPAPPRDLALNADLQLTWS